MPQAKNITLHVEILTQLQSGPLTTHELAAALDQPVKRIARTCSCMEQDDELMHIGPRKAYLWHSPNHATEPSVSEDKTLMNRPDCLGSAILSQLSAHGPMNTNTLAQNLQESPRAIAASCVNLARWNLIHSYKSGNFYKAPYGKKIMEVLWERGGVDCPPPRPVRRKPSAETEKRLAVGIDEADIEWMERYRQQAAWRRNMEKKTRQR